MSSHYQDSAGFIALGVIFPILAVAFGILRWQSRKKYQAGYGLDDAFIIPATLLVIVTGIAMIVGAARNVLGATTTDPSSQTEIDMEQEMQKWELTLISLHTWSTSLIRLSILFFYRRIFRGRFRLTHFDVINWTIIFITVFNLVGFFIATLVINVPNIGAPVVPAITHMTLTGFALSTAWLQSKAAIINFAFDMQVALVPMCRVTRIQMSWARKLQAMSVFAVGLFAVAAACARMVIVIRLDNFATDHRTLAEAAASSVFSVNGADTLGTISTYLFWSYMEMSVGLIVASLPAAFRLLDWAAIQNFLAKYGLSTPSAAAVKPGHCPPGVKESDELSERKKRTPNISEFSRLESDASKSYTEKSYLDKITPQGSHAFRAERGEGKGYTGIAGGQEIGVRTVIEVTRFPEHGSHSSMDVSPV